MYVRTSHTTWLPDTSFIIQIHMYVCTSVYTYSLPLHHLSDRNPHTYVYTCECAHMHMYVHTNVRICAHSQTYVHTHNHVNKNALCLISTQITSLHWLSVLHIKGTHTFTQSRAWTRCNVFNTHTQYKLPGRECVYIRMDAYTNIHHVYHRHPNTFGQGTYVRTYACTWYLFWEATPRDMWKVVFQSGGLWLGGD